MKCLSQRTTKRFQVDSRLGFAPTDKSWYLILVFKIEDFIYEVEEIVGRGQKDRKDKVHMNSYKTFLEEVNPKTRPEINSNSLRIALILYMFATVGNVKKNVSFTY